MLLFVGLVFLCFMGCGVVCRVGGRCWKLLVLIVFSVFRCYFLVLVWWLGGFWLGVVGSVGSCMVCLVFVDDCWWIVGWRLYCVFCVGVGWRGWWVDCLVVCVCCWFVVGWLIVLGVWFCCLCWSVGNVVVWWFVVLVDVFVLNFCVSFVSFCCWFVVIRCGFWCCISFFWYFGRDCWVLCWFLLRLIGFCCWVGLGVFVVVVYWVGWLLFLGWLSRFYLLLVCLVLKGCFGGGGSVGYLDGC